MSFAYRVFKLVLAHGNAAQKNIALEILRYQHTKRFPQSCKAGAKIH